MNNETNVLNMHQYVHKLGPRAFEIMQQSELLAISIIEAAVKSMMDKADDTLFDLANSADSNTQQQLYFDAMRDIRLRRKHIEQQFIEMYKQEFGLFAAGKPLGMDLQDIVPVQEMALELVDDTSMEENIALANMASRSIRENYQPLYELTIRLSELSERPQLAHTQHPLSPNSVAHAIGACLEPMDIEIHVKLIIYKLFDKYVMSNLGQVFKDVNTLLIKLGILPSIRHKVKTNPNKAGAYPGQPSETQSDAGQIADQDHTHTHTHNGLHGYHGAPVSNVAAPYKDYISYAGNQFVATEGSHLLGALTAMQDYVLSDVPEVLDTPAMIGNQVLNLSSQIATLQGKPHSNAEEDHAINMVSLIFEYILEDRNIPDPIKALLARLQIPYLKISLLDKAFFSQSQHPARKLLNKVARFSTSWSFDEDLSQDALLLKVRAITACVLENFSDNTGLFEELLADFESFIQQEEAQNFIFEERVRKTQEGKDRLKVAKARVNAWIQTWVSREDVPAFLSDFLQDTWRNILQVTMLKHGEDSEAWQTHVKTINTLIWSISPDKSAEDGKKLVEVLPSLIKFLRSGMDDASVHPNIQQAFLEQLAQFHVQAVNGARPRELRDSGSATSTAGSESVPEAGSATRAIQDKLLSEHQKGVDASFSIDADEADLRQLEAVSEEIVIEAPDSQASVDPYDYEDEYTELADQLEVGDWLEFYDTEGNGTRVKLSWHSRLSGSCLFVTRKGSKYAEKSLASLATELRCGRAQVMDKVPVMDRAISMLVGRLQDRV